MSGSTERPAPTLSERVQSLRLPDGDAGAGRGSRVPWALAVVFLLTTVYFALEAVTPVDEATLNQAVEERLAELNPGSAPNAPARGASPAAAPGAPSSAAAETGEIALESKGYIIPVHQIQVSPLVGGRVVKLNIAEGMTVPKDFVIAELETTEYQADYDRTAAQLRGAQARWNELWKYRENEVRQAKAELEDSVAQRDQLYADWKRSEQLRSRDALAPKEYEQAESAYKSQNFRVQRLQLVYDLLVKGPRDERIAAAKAEVGQWQAELVKAKWKLDNATVRAPLAGTILTKKAEEGNFVNPSAFSNGLSASLCDMADLADMEVDLAVSERDIAKVAKNQECKVRAEAYPDRYYKGYVSRIMPTADRGKAAVPVRVKIIIPHEEAGQFLRPDMGALVTFYNKQYREQ
jgi:multidrug resistance efflux pump